MLGEVGTAKTSVSAEPPKAERELRAIAAQHDGMGGLIAERQRA